MPKLDERLAGAQCHKCPFNGQPVVFARPLDSYVNPPVGIGVGEGPGKTEVGLGEPFVGASGLRLDKCLTEAGIDKSQVYLTNSTLCLPPKNATPDDVAQAVECCRPRLIRELDKVVSRWPHLRDRPILGLGKRALQASEGKDRIFDWCGPPRQSGSLLTGVRPTQQHLATLHPAFVLGHRAPHYTGVLRMHVHRVVRAWEGKLIPWAWPEMTTTVNRTMRDRLRAIRAHPEWYVGADTETSGRYDAITGWHKKENEQLRLLDIGFAVPMRRPYGSKGFAVCVPWWQLDYRDPLHVEIAELTRDILRSHPRLVWQNEYYDRIVLRMLMGVRMAEPVGDTMLAHYVLSPLISHKLGFQAAIEFPVERWKEEFRAGDDLGGKRYAKADPIERAIYCMQDCQCTALLLPLHEQRLRAHVHNGMELYRQYMRLNVIAAAMRIKGATVKRQTRLKHDAWLGERANSHLEWLHETTQHIGVPDFNPNSRFDLIKVFAKLGIESPARTATGDPSYTAKVLLDIVAGHDKLASQVAKNVLLYRKYTKMRSTYVQYLPVKESLRLTDVDFEDDGAPAGKVEIVESTHSSWLPYRAKSGRWGSKENNMQNVGKAKLDEQNNVIVPSVRDMFEGDRHYQWQTIGVD